MTDTRIEDRTVAFTKNAKETHPEWTDEQIAAAVAADIAASIASSQTGDQVWLNRPAGLNLDEYMGLSTALRALFTDDEIKAMSSAESIAAFQGDPISYLAKYGRYREFTTKFLHDHP